MTAGAKAVLDIFEERRIVDHVKETGAYLSGKLDQVVEKYAVVKERRGMGLIQGLELTGPAAPVVTAALLEQKLVLISAGTNIIRFVPRCV